MPTLNGASLKNRLSTPKITPPRINKTKGVFPSSSVQNSTHQLLLPAAYIQSSNYPGNAEIAPLSLSFTHWSLVPHVNIPSSVTEQCFIKSEVLFFYIEKNPKQQTTKQYQSGPRGCQLDKVCSTH